MSPAGTGPVFYQNEASPSGDDRVTQQGYAAAAAGHAGQGTLLLATDGTTNYSLSSFDDAGVQIDAGAPHLSGRRRVSGGDHRLPADRDRAGEPGLPLATDSVTVTAAVNDASRRSRA